MHLTETTITTFTGEYVVEAYLTMPGDNRPDWHKVMNFGLRLGDAIDARNHDIPTMPLEAFTGEIAAEQDRIRAERPRLRPVSIFLSFPPKGWTGTITHITMGQASVAVIEVAGEQYGEKVDE